MPYQKGGEGGSLLSARRITPIMHDRKGKNFVLREGKRHSTLERLEKLPSKCIEKEEKFFTEGREGLNLLQRNNLRKEREKPLHEEGGRLPASGRI